MIRDKEKFFFEIYQVIDFLALGAAFLLAYYTKVVLVPDIVRGLAAGQNYTLIFLLISIFCQFNLRFTETYPPFKYESLSVLIIQIIKAIFFGFLFAILLLYLTHLADISRLLMVLFALYAVIFLSVIKGAMFFVQVKKHPRAYDIKEVLLVGARDRSLDVIEAIMDNPNSGYRIVGCLETAENADKVGQMIHKMVRIVGTLDDFSEILLKGSVDEIIFALPLKNIKLIHNYFYIAEKMGIKIRVMPDFQIHKIKFFPIETAHVYIDHFLGLPTIAVSSIKASELGLFVKSVIDYVSAALGLIVLAPFFLFIGIAIKMTSPGPVFFYQERCGLNGRHFFVRKFRTMYEDAEGRREELEKDNEMDGPVFKIKDDPRITRIGQFLRKTSLDELPQLINVLRGEMSLVGPRPPIPDEVEKYKLWQRRRLSMKPGITCIWQVSGRNETSFEQWMDMDLEYIDNWSLRLDFKLLFLTLKEVTGGGGR